MTIIDLPGTSDVNLARAEITKEYIRTCDFVWVVSRIDRVVDDGATLSFIYRLGRLLRGRVMVIATHFDANIEAALARELKAEGRDVEAWFELTDEIKSKRNETKAIGKEIKKACKISKTTKATHLILPEALPLHLLHAQSCHLPMTT